MKQNAQGQEKQGWAVVKEQQLLRPTRNGHEEACLGTKEANRKCRGCGETSHEVATDSVAWRRTREAKCKIFRSIARNRKR